MVEWWSRGTKIKEIKEQRRGKAVRGNEVGGRLGWRDIKYYIIYKNGRIPKKEM
jgi:hypothetical protein